MLGTIRVGGALALLAVVVVVASAKPVAAAEQAEARDRGFTVLLDSAATSESVVPAIVAAGRAQLVAACESGPRASIRIHIEAPATAGVDADVPCATVLGEGESTGEAREALTSEASDGPIGESPQRLTPLGPILCGLTSLLTTTAQDRVCRDWRGKGSELCNVGTFGSGAMWVLACALAF
jgi:hypothetical protein